ncbi:uncharacterized protein LOC126743288 [Anthonomus grandis grandis]|uniref:uncharacterized protein LOC126743288 n=1 Tax=Anthonomus grandis grandis TaxID=2921223 RepID=UPI002165E779|nr:uncharacterized protein LOC126743288 [Anthonomus grandis grandis]
MYLGKADNLLGLTLGLIGWFWGAKAFKCPSDNALMQPQLSATFLNGYWYEHLYINTLLNGEECSHYEIECVSNSTCVLRHVIWNSYNLELIWNGTIIQDSDGVRMIIEERSYSNVFLKYDSDMVLLWACSEEDASITEFASIFKRVDDERDVYNVWEDAKKDMKYLGLADEFPAGWWKKVDTDPCTNNGNYPWKMHVPLIFLHFVQVFF